MENQTQNDKEAKLKQNASSELQPLGTQLDFSWHVREIRICMLTLNTDNSRHRALPHTVESNQIQLLLEGALRLTAVPHN